VIDSYTSELLSQEYPSLIEALPKNIREPVLDAIAGLQLRIAEHIREVLRNEEARESIRQFVTRRVDDILGGRVSELVDVDAFQKFTTFVDARIRQALPSKTFEDRFRDFISRRLDELVHTETPLGEMFTEDAVGLLKEKANEQIEPIVHQLTQIAAA